MYPAHPPEAANAHGKVSHNAGLCSMQVCAECRAAVEACMGPEVKVRVRVRWGAGAGAGGGDIPEEDNNTHSCKKNLLNMHTFSLSIFICLLQFGKILAPPSSSSMLFPSIVSSIKYTTNCLCYMHWLSLISFIFIGMYFTNNTFIIFPLLLHCRSFMDSYGPFPTI